MNCCGKDNTADPNISQQEEAQFRQIQEKMREVPLKERVSNVLNLVNTPNEDIVSFAEILKRNMQDSVILGDDSANVSQNRSLTMEQQSKSDQPRQLPKVAQFKEETTASQPEFMVMETAEDEDYRPQRSMMDGKQSLARARVQNIGDDFGNQQMIQPVQHSQPLPTHSEPPNQVTATNRFLASQQLGADTQKLLNPSEKFENSQVISTLNQKIDSLSRQLTELQQRQNCSFKVCADFMKIIFGNGKIRFVKLQESNFSYAERETKIVISYQDQQIEIMAQDELDFEVKKQKIQQLCQKVLAEQREILFYDDTVLFQLNEQPFLEVPYAELKVDLQSGGEIYVLVFSHAGKHVQCYECDKDEADKLIKYLSAKEVRFI